MFHVKHPDPVKGARIKSHDLDIEYEVRVRKAATGSRRRSGQEYTWKVVVQTSDLLTATKSYEKYLRKGRRVRVFQYATETVVEELFI